MASASRVLRNAARQVSKAAGGSAEPMSADHTLYHVAPTGFWKKFRDAIVVNPEISTGLPIPELNRYPQPGSRTESYATPATQASDPAFNPYYKRDVRRNYPQTSTITQSHLTAVLLASPSATPSISGPETKLEAAPNSHAIAPGADAEGGLRAVTTSDIPELTSVLAKLPGTAFLGGGIKTGEGSGSKLPPVPPKLGKKWVPVETDDVPHQPFDYWPMAGYK